MRVTIEFDQRSVQRYYDDVHNAAVKKALPSTLNRTLAKTKTRVKRRISQKTGVAQKQITSLIRERKASRASLSASMSIRARTPNAIRFNGKKTKKAFVHTAFKKRIINKRGFIVRDSFALKRKTTARDSKLESIYGPNVARAFGAPKNMAVYQRYARIIMAKEYEARYKFFASRIKRKRG